MSLNHSIPLSVAIEMTRSLRENRNAVLAEQYQHQDILAICETFDAGEIQALLNQDNCVSLRIYYGMDESKKIHAILVGADSEGRDILPPAGSDVEGQIMEDGKRCPTMCPPESPLNGE